MAKGWRKNPPVTLVCRECGKDFIVEAWKAKDRAFCNRTCSARWMTKHDKRKKGWYKNNRGYILVYQPTHPMASKAGYVMQHRLVMSKQIGRSLTRAEVVHHKNGKMDDNRLENLELRTKVQHDRMPKNRKERVITCPDCGREITVPWTARAAARKQRKAHLNQPQQ